MTNNIPLIKKLARLGVLDTEPVKYKKEGDIVIENSNGENVRVIVDDIPNDELSLMIAAEQLKTTKYIKSVVKGYVIVCAIAFGVVLLNYLIQLGWNM